MYLHSSRCEAGPRSDVLYRDGAEGGINTLPAEPRQRAGKTRGLYPESVESFGDTLLAFILFLFCLSSAGAAAESLLIYFGAGGEGRPPLFLQIHLSASYAGDDNCIYSSAELRGGHRNWSEMGIATIFYSKVHIKPFGKRPVFYKKPIG